MKINNYVIKLSQFIIGSNLYISIVSFIMILGINIQFNYVLNTEYAIFIFFSTLSSYNLHWYFTEIPKNKAHIVEGQFRNNFNVEYKNTILGLFIISSLISIYILWMNQHWIQYVLPAIIATLIYSAPKFPSKQFKKLEGKAYVKTFYLAAVWLYVTNILPMLLNGTYLDINMILYLLANYIFIYIICLLFDYRDQENEELNYIFINNIKYFESVISILIVLFMILIMMMLVVEISFSIILSILIPFILLYTLIAKSKRTKSDYWYYFILDGLMCAPSIIIIIIKYSTLLTYKLFD